MTTSTPTKISTHAKNRLAKVQNSERDPDLLAAQEAWVERTMQSLTLREKVGQTVQEVCGADLCQNEERAMEYFQKYPLGSLFCGGEIIKGAGNGADVIRERVALCQRSSRIPLLVAGDLEHGAGAAVQGLTKFPHPLALGATNDASLAYELGKFTALEGRHAGFNWTYSPVIDLAQNWMNPIVANRSLGDRPRPVSRLALAVIRGLQDHGMAACAKHFPGDGVDFRDQHLVTSINSLSEKKWWANHGAVFQSVIDAGVQTIMAGHIALPWFEPFPKNQLRPRPATVSFQLLTALLRRRMGFEGVIVSDALIMAGYTGWADRQTRLIESFNAGIDVMLWPGTDYFEMIERALDDGRVSMQRIEESARRVLRLKAQLGLHEAASVQESRSAISELSVEIRSAAQSAAARIAEQSVTLVRNRAALLPLDPAKTKRVLLHKAVPTELNPRALEHLEKMVDLIRARGIEVTVLQNGNCLDIEKLEKAGQHWDAYLVVYSLQCHQLKNTIRPTGPMGEVIWTQQNTLHLKPITISLGTPFLQYEMPFLDTLINAYSPSETVIEALVKALFGETSFVGHSPVNLDRDAWIG